MSFIALFMIAVGLSMDAFAVAVCKGLGVQRVKMRHAAITGLYFGGFQGLMPVIGWLLGYKFEHLITSVDHWIAFVLLGLIGANMIKEAFSKEEECCECNELSDDFSPKTMLPMAVATSIDALAVGITFAFLQVNILLSAALVGVTTFLLSGAGVYIGNIFGAKYKSRAEFAGGAILIIMGLKILLEHLGIIA